MKLMQKKSEVLQDFFFDILNTSAYFMIKYSTKIRLKYYLQYIFKLFSQNRKFVYKLFDCNAEHNKLISTQCTISYTKIMTIDAVLFYITTEDTVLLYREVVLESKNWLNQTEWALIWEAVYFIYFYF